MLGTTLLEGGHAQGRGLHGVRPFKVALLYSVLTPADRGHVVELATNVYSTHVVQKALDCDEDVRRLIVQELLADDIAKTLTSKHCSHVWAKVMEIANWTPPVPPIFAVFVTLIDTFPTL